MYFEINLFFLSGHLSGAHTHPFPGFTGPKMLPSEQEKKTDLDIGTTKLRLMSQKRFGASWALREEKDLDGQGEKDLDGQGDQYYPGEFRPLQTNLMKSEHV